MYIVVSQHKNAAFIECAFNDLASAEAMALKMRENYANGEFPQPIPDVLVMQVKDDGFRWL